MYPAFKWIKDIGGGDTQSQSSARIPCGGNKSIYVYVHGKKNKKKYFTTTMVQDTFNIFNIFCVDGGHQSLMQRCANNDENFH